MANFIKNFLFLSNTVNNSDSETESDNEIQDNEIPDSKIPDSKIPDSEISDNEIPNSEIPNSEIVNTANIINVQQNKNKYIGSDILKSKTLGKTINKTQKYIMRLISIKNLVSNVEKGIINIPEFQRDINPNKIKSLLIAFEKNNEIYNYVTNPLQVAYFVHDDCTNLLLIDGQHRYNMYKYLYEQNRIPNHELLINFIKCENIDEIVNIYLSLNWDNPNIIHLSNEMRSDAETILLTQRYRSLKNDLAQYKQCWKKNSNVLYDTEEYVTKLIEINFLDNFNTNADAIKYILDLNDFYISYYDNLLKKDNVLTKFKKDELSLLKNKIDKPFIWTFKNNNFLQALNCSDDTIDDFVFQHYIMSPKTINNKIKIVPKSLPKNV